MHPIGANFIPTVRFPAPLEVIKEDTLVLEQMLKDLDALSIKGTFNGRDIIQIFSVAQYGANLDKLATFSKELNKFDLKYCALGSFIPTEEFKKILATANEKHEAISQMYRSGIPELPFITLFLDEGK